MNRQLEFMYPYPVEDGWPMLMPVVMRMLGMNWDPEMAKDVALFLEAAGLKLHDVEPAAHVVKIAADDPREVDLSFPDGELTCVWSPDLPTGLSITEDGRVVGTLGFGPYEFTVHVGPQVKFDALGGSGSPNEEGGWIGALEDREPVPTVDMPDVVAGLSAEDRDALRAALDAAESTGVTE